MVLLMTINCTCGNAIAAFVDFGADSAETDHGCCAAKGNAAGSDHRAPSKDKQHSHNESCQHCQPTTVPEPAVVKHAISVFSYEWTPTVDVIVTAAAVRIFIPGTNPWHQASGLPPPVGPPTLLSLGCALNT